MSVLTEYHHPLFEMLKKHLKIMTETILCAAIWYKTVERAYHRPINTPEGVVLCGHRHGHIISQVKVLTGKKQFEMGESIQGFLTSQNRFVDRDEAS